MRALLALLLLAAAALPCAQARDALQAIDDCVARLDSELDVGYGRIAARCPDLAATLSESPWAQWLPAEWQRPDNQLSAAGLSELRAQLIREAGAQVRARALRTERVAAVLAEVARSEDAGDRSWWQRFKDWLRSMLATRAPAEDGWLRRWLADIRPSTHAAQLIAWGALAAVVALAAGIVINELRIAGFLRDRESPLRQRRGAPPRARPAAAALEEIDRAAPEQQPALLLELIGLRLAAQQRLPPARALTARELERQACLPEESGRTRLAQLVTVCERVRFAGEPVSAASLAAAVRSGRSLLAALEAAAPPPVPAAEAD